jgi:AcrR family transcriptional regulator
MTERTDSAQDPAPVQPASERTNVTRQATKAKAQKQPRGMRNALGTREKIKDVAQQMIAKHGVDGISIRDIIIAAGQRNMASLYYYFRSKEELIRELMVDAADLMEGVRADYLARLEEIGEPLTVRQIAHVLISGAKLEPTRGGRQATFMRFVTTVAHTHRHLFLEAMGNPHNKTYQRLLDLLRRQLQHVPLVVLNQRLLFFTTCCTSLLMAREEALSSEGHSRDYWSQPGIYQNMLDFMCAGLSAPVTQPEAAFAQTPARELQEVASGANRNVVGATTGEDERVEDTITQASPRRPRAGGKKPRARA